MFLKFLSLVFLYVLNIKVLLELLSCVQMTRQKKMLRRCRRSGEESEARPYQDLSKTWFSSENQYMQLGGQYAKTGQSHAFLGINQQMKVHDIAPRPYNNVNTPLFSPSGHTSMQIHNLVTPILSQF